MPTTDEIKQRIEAALPGARVDVTGDGHHFSATVVAPEFAGLSRIQQHRRVYDAFAPGELGGAVHALSLSTRPE
jgi:acid stress-induced BolA-like protein IbaG/YrbA